jgi:hypothetical protein
LQEIGIPNLSDVLADFFAPDEDDNPARKKLKPKAKK